MKDLQDLRTRIKAIWADIQWVTQTDADPTPPAVTELLDQTRSFVDDLDKIIARRTPRQIGAETDHQMVEFLEGVTGVVDADDYAYHSLWERFSEEGKKFFDTGDRIRYSWESNRAGLRTCVGTYDGRECWVSLTTAVVNGQKLLFYYGTSTFVDHDLIRTWLDANIPATGRQSDGRIHHTDATNFVNILRR
jgi:hypothetical protein